MVDVLALTWLFPVVITIHNVEEAIWLPRWSKSAGRWHHPVAAVPFRFAVTILTILAYLVAALSAYGGKSSIGSYLLAGYALAMLLNVVAPHVVASLVLQKYAPGTATAILFNLPVTAWLLYRLISEQYIDLGWFYWTGPLTVLVILASIPLLFTIGGKLWKTTV